MTTDTISTEAVPPEAVPPIPAELRQRIAALIPEAGALLPAITELSERARSIRREYWRVIHSLGVDAVGEVKVPPGYPFGVSGSCPATDYATYRDGLDTLGDAVYALHDALATVFESIDY